MVSRKLKQEITNVTWIQGKVYRGHGLSDKGPLALKVERCKSESQRTPLKQEYNVYKLLSGGPGIMKIEQFEYFDGYNGLSCELLGPSLESIMQSNTVPFDPISLYNIADQTVSNSIDKRAITKMFLRSKPLNLFTAAELSIGMSNQTIFSQL